MGSEQAEQAKADRALVLQMIGFPQTKRRLQWVEDGLPARAELLTLNKLTQALASARAQGASKLADVAEVLNQKALSVMAECDDLRTQLATIHARYAGLVEAAKMRRDELEEERCELWTDAEAKLLEELEKLNDGK